MEITKNKLIQIINLHEKSKEMYQAFKQIDQVPYFAEKNLLITEDLIHIMVDTFVLPNLIISILDLPEDNSYKYLPYYFDGSDYKYKKHIIKDMVCHNSLVNYCWEWFDGEKTTQELADEIIEYVKVFKKGNK